MTEQGAVAGETSLLGAGVAGLAWVWFTPNQSVLPWTGIGASIGLLIGLDLWTVRKVAASVWEPGVRRSARVNIVVFSVVLLGGVSFLQMMLVHGFRWLWHAIT